MFYTDEIKAKSSKLEIVIRYGAEIDTSILNKVREIALSAIEFPLGEKEYFLAVLNNPKLYDLEDWQLAKFIRIAEKANVRIIFEGKENLLVQSTEVTRQQLITHLKNSYLKRTLIKLNPLFDDGSTPRNINDTSVNLVSVVNENTQNSIEHAATEKSNQNIQIQYSYAQKYNKKENFPLVELFKPLQNPVSSSHVACSGDLIPNRIMITGSAGIGKSVLCQYLTVMWASDIKESSKRWWFDETKAVIWIKLRNLAKYDPKNCCLGEVVRRECFGIEDSKDTRYPSAIQIDKDLQALSDKVVMILDGFDEVAEWYEEYEMDHFQSLTPRSELLKFELLGGRYKYRIILTSRPNQLEKLKDGFDRKLETIGFNDQDIQQYIKSFFHEKPYDCELLIDNIRKNCNLSDMVHIPINLALICAVFQENGGRTLIHESMTLTDLYASSIIWLLRRDWAKHPIESQEDAYTRKKRLELLGATTKDLKTLDQGNIGKKARELTWKDFETKLVSYSTKLNILEDLAWEAEQSEQHSVLISGVIVVACLNRYYEVNLPETECYEILNIIKTLGMLDAQYEDDTRKIKNNYYSFPHLTFQEFFAAKFWIRMFCSDKEKDREKANKWFYQYKYHPRLEKVWWFVSGLLSKTDSQLSKEFFCLFRDSPRDATGLREIGLLIRCLEECGFSELESDLVEVILHEVIDWIKWLIKKGSSSYTFLYEFFKQSPKVLSQPKIVQFIVNEIRELEDFSDIYFYKLLRFFCNIPPKNIEILMSIIGMLGKASEEIHVRFISGAMTENSFDNLNDNDLQVLMLKLFSLIDQGNHLERFGGYKVCQILPLERLNKNQVETLIRIYLGSSTQLEIETQKILLGAVAKLLRFLVYQKESENRRKLLSFYFSHIEGSTAELKYEMINLIETFIFDQIDDDILSFILETLMNGLQDESQLVRLGVVNILPTLPWERVKDKRRILETLIHTLNEQQSDKIDTAEKQVRLAVLRIYLRLPWRIFDLDVSDILIQSCLNMIKDVDKRTSYQAVEVIGKLISERLIEIPSIARVVQYCIKVFNTAEHIADIIVAIRIVPKLIPFYSDTIVSEELMMACIQKLDDKNKAIKDAALYAIQKISSEMLPEKVGDRLLVYCNYNLKNGDVFIKESIKLLPLALRVTSNNIIKAEVINTCKSILKDERADLSIRLGVIKIFLYIPIDKDMKTDYIQCVADLCIEGLKNKKRIGTTLEALQGLPWDLLSQDQVNKIFELHLETLTTTGSPTREISINIFIKFLIKYLPSRSMNVLINRCIVELHGLDILRRDAYSKLLEHVPRESFTVNQIRQLIDYCLQNSETEDSKSENFELLNHVSWWKVFEKEHPQTLAECSKFMSDFLTCCVYTQVNAYFIPEESIVCFVNTYGRDIKINFNPAVWSILDNEKVKLNIPIIFGKIAEMPRGKLELSKNKSRFSYGSEEHTNKALSSKKVTRSDKCILF